MTDIETQEDVQNLISRNAAVSLLANLFYLATRIILPPIILHYITLVEYGLWSYCFILISYISMGAFGVSNVYMRYIAVFSAHKETQQINGLVSTGVFSVFFLTLLMTPIIWFLLPYILTLFQVDESLKHEAFYLLFGTILIFFIDLTLSVFSSLLQSLQKFTLERSIWIFSVAIETVLIILFLVMGFGLFGLMWAYLIRVVVSVALFMIASYRIVPSLSICLSHFDTKLLKLFLNFGGIVQLTGIISTINRSIEKVFAGLFLGPAATALYEVGKKFPTTAIFVPSSVNAVLLPATAHLHAKQMHDQILDIYFHGSRWVNLITGTIMGFLAPFSFPLITCWLGTRNPKFEIAIAILTWFSIACQMDTMTGPASAIYRSINRPARELVYCSLQFVLVILAAVLLFSIYGYSFTTINISVVSMDVLSALIYLFLCNRFFQFSQTTFALRVILPGFVPYLCGFIIYWIMRPWFLMTVNSRYETFGLLLLGLFLYLAVTLPVIYFLLCEKEERQKIRRQLIHTFRELSGKK